MWGIATQGTAQGWGLEEPQGEQGAREVQSDWHRVLVKKGSCPWRVEKHPHPHHLWALSSSFQDCTGGGGPPWGSDLKRATSRNFQAM